MTAPNSGTKISCTAVYGRKFLLESTRQKTRAVITSKLIKFSPLQRVPLKLVQKKRFQLNAKINTETVVKANVFMSANADE